MLTGARLLIARWWTRWRDLMRSRSGIAAVEFAFICPALVVMFGASVELSGVITAANRATYVAEAIAQVVSQARKPITIDEMKSYIRSAALVDPDIVQYARVSGKPLDAAVNVAVASVKFDPTVPGCVTGCDYKASVVFGTSLTGPRRACGSLAKAPGLGLGSLPADLFTSSPLVVVDVEVFHRPIMTTILGTEISFRRQAYFRPRSVPVVEYQDNCPGY